MILSFRCWAASFRCFSASSPLSTDGDNNRGLLLPSGVEGEETDEADKNEVASDDPETAGDADADPDAAVDDDDTAEPNRFDSWSICFTWALVEELK